MSKHTEGPWVVDSDGHYPIIIKHIRPGHHMKVCGAVHGYMYSDDEKGNQEANARLISAAPDLLDALEAAEDQLSRWPYTSEVIKGLKHPNTLIQQIRAAIAKAKGTP